jgi:hypothetical protein
MVPLGITQRNKSAPENLAPLRLASDKLALLREALEKSEFDKSEREKTAFLKLVFWAIALDKFALVITAVSNLASVKWMCCTQNDKLS